MVATVGLIERVQAFTTLGAAWFIEMDPDLADAVGSSWTQDLTDKGGPEFMQIARNVWDLLRNECYLLRRLLNRIPPRALLLIPGGSPCQDLSGAGHLKGRLGLCGKRSYNFYIFPFVLWMVQQLRPDINVVPVIENTSWMQDHFLLTILRVFGLSRTFVALLDTKQWTAVSRLRVFIMPRIPPSIFRRPRSRKDPF